MTKKNEEPVTLVWMGLGFLLLCGLAALFVAVIKSGINV